MDFKEWLVNYNRENGHTLSDDDDFESVKEAVSYDNPLPCDSYDRLYALYLLDCHKSIIDEFDVQKACQDKEYADKQFNTLLDNEGIKEEFMETLFFMSYENYEREGISHLVAFVNMVNVAQHGRDAVLNDSYKNNGWFGAS